jgi:hypothetical protein
MEIIHFMHLLLSVINYVIIIKIINNTFYLINYYLLKIEATYQ